MLCNFFHLKELNFGKLMDLYAEGNLEKAREEFFKDDLNLAVIKAEQEFYQYLKDIFFAVDGAVYCVWEEDGKYLSALRLEPYLDGLLLEALETHPAYRRKGYAKRLISEVLTYLRKTDATTVYAHVHKKNAASLQTHLVSGFQRIAEQAVYIDGSVNSNCCTFQYLL